MKWTPPTTNLDATPRVALPEGQRMGAMEEICERHGLPTRGLALFASGSDVVFGGDGFVIKLSTPMWAGQMANERRVLERVEGALPVETPRVLASGALEGWPYLVMHRLEGMRSLASVWGELDGRGRRRVAGDLGGVVAALHALPVSDEDAAAWGAWLAARKASVVERFAAAVPAGWAPVEDFVGGVEARDAALGWLHTELLGEHVLVGGDGRVAGMIDFADARVGHPDYDWPGAVEFVFKGEPGCLRALLEGYGLSGGVLAALDPRRLAVWSLWHRYGHLKRAIDAAGAPVPAGWGEWVERLYGLGRV
ncbi:MAG: aminoglycoside 3'-phosphotransferase/choline kinase family protein [bacterium]